MSFTQRFNVESGAVVSACETGLFVRWGDHHETRVRLNATKNHNVRLRHRVKELEELVETQGLLICALAQQAGWEESPL